MKLSDLTQEQINGILDHWARGDTTREIGARFQIDHRKISVVARKAQERGDPRAVSRMPLSALVKSKNQDERNVEILALHKQGLSSTEIGKRYNLHAGSVRKAIGSAKALLNIPSSPSTQSRKSVGPRLCRVFRGTGAWSCLLIYVPINFEASDKRQSMIERILDLWVQGVATKEIAAANGITKNAVLGIARRARDNGDPRAVDRGEKSRFQPKPRAPVETSDPGEQEVMPKNVQLPVPSPIVYNTTNPPVARLPLYKPASAVPAPVPTGKRSLLDIERELAAEEKAVRARLGQKALPSTNGHNGTPLYTRRPLTPADRRERDKIPADFVSNAKPLFDPDTMPPYGKRLITQVRGPSDSGPGDCKYATEYHPEETHRHRFCGRPAVHPHSYCAEHALLVTNWNYSQAPGERLRLQLLCEAA